MKSTGILIWSLDTVCLFDLFFCRFSLRHGLFHRAKEIRTACLRALRYFCQDFETVKAMVALHIDYLIVRYGPNDALLRLYILCIMNHGPHGMVILFLRRTLVSLGVLMTVLSGISVMQCSSMCRICSLKVNKFKMNSFHHLCYHLVQMVKPG